MWFKNTDGKPDAMLTFSIIAFSAIMFNVILSTFGATTLFGITFTFVALDAGTIAALLGPTLTAYVGRRFIGTAYAEPSKKRELTESLSDSAEELDNFIPSGER